MISLDLVNGTFEAFGAVAIWGNVRRIMRDKMVRGIDWRSVAFFTSWGYWNMLYYPSLDQWFSTAAGAVLALGNTVWIALYWKYRNG